MNASSIGTLGSKPPLMIDNSMASATGAPVLLLFADSDDEVDDDDDDASKLSIANCTLD